MRFLSVAVLLLCASTTHADPPITATRQIAHRKPDIALRGITFELSGERTTKPLSQRRILRTRGDGPSALLSRSSTKRWFVGIPGVQRLTKLQTPHTGLAVTVIGARF